MLDRILVDPQSFRAVINIWTITFKYLETFSAAQINEFKNQKTFFSVSFPPPKLFRWNRFWRRVVKKESGRLWFLRSRPKAVPSNRNLSGIVEIASWDGLRHAEGNLQKKRKHEVAQLPWDTKCRRGGGGCTVVSLLAFRPSVLSLIPSIPEMLLRLIYAAA